MKKWCWIAMSVLIVIASDRDALAQSAGNFMVSAGPAWLDMTRSSATPLVSSSAAGTFSSPTSAEIHNAFTAEFIFSHFVTDHIAIEAAGGVPPKLSLFPQGVTMPVGPAGPSLGLGKFKPISTTRAWAPIVFAKYYFASPASRFRPYFAVGLNYTCSGRFS